MSNDSFVKLIRSDHTEFLVSEWPHAFLLLTLIAYRALREDDPIRGLIAGDALLGDYKSCGLTRQQYRTALKKLEEFGYIEIITNGKSFFKREKSTIKITITGTLVNIKNSKVYDINKNTFNHQSNQQLTNSQPTANHEQEYKEDKNIEIKEKNIKKEKQVPLQVGTPVLVGDGIVSQKPMQHNLYYPPNCELVKIPLEEHEKFVMKHGAEVMQRAYEVLNDYKIEEIKLNGGEPPKKKYSDIGRIKSWGIRTARENILKDKELDAKEQRLGKIIPNANNREKAKEIAKQYHERSSKFEFMFTTDGKGVVFNPLVGGTQHILFFNDQGFIEQLKNNFIKFDFKKINQENNTQYSDDSSPVPSPILVEYYKKTMDKVHNA